MMFDFFWWIIPFALGGTGLYCAGYSRGCQHGYTDGYDDAAQDAAKGRVLHD